MAYTITDNFISHNRPKTPLKAVGMVVHDTDTKGATDEAEQKYFDNGAAGRSASAHAFIDWDSITRTIPFNEQAWHAGATANHRFIGIELCVPKTHDPAAFQEVWNRAVWLFADTFINVIKQTTITKDNLMSHAEVSAKWKETTHQDPVAYFKEYGKTVDDFRTAVQKAINDIIHPAPKPNPAVLKLQAEINRLKFGTVGVTGFADPGTIAIIKIAQKALGLGTDIASLEKAIAEILAKPTLATGSTGVAVKYIQYRLNMSNDGVFGPATLSAVKAFQIKNKLSADGKVGPNTWAKLIG